MVVRNPYLNFENTMDSNFEIANRAFYATIDKFTRQSCPDASRRRSFLENWHLHSIYSKSQQTLLGITPVKPSVLLSGDDFMFTPPFIQPDEQEPEDDDDYIDDLYLLSPCSEPSLFDCEEEYYAFETPLDDWPSLSILIPDHDSPEEDDEPELSPCSSIDENPTSTHSSITTIDESVLPKPVTKSNSKSSSLDDIMSYQSLADLIHIKNSNNYGSTTPATDHEIIEPPPPPSSSIWDRVVIYFMYLWQVLIHFACFTEEQQPLLP